MVKSLLLGVALFAFAGTLCTHAQNQSDARPDSYRANSRAADPRFKADILLVVAHPDDEVMAAAYLAREISDHQRRVAVVFQTPGDGGNNDVGAEQAAALGDIRQMEARRAVGFLGITNVWFLGGHDTPSQNVLASLEHCGHGRCLDELVRIVRITQPAVILTWLPDFVTGENHADHQASGVLATEAFDLAGDPAAFAEQISPATDPAANANLTEGLRPWQPQKLYYFVNASHDMPAGQGPQYASKEVSPARHESYGVLAAEEFSYHRTQGGDAVAQQITQHSLETATGEIADIVNRPVHLIYGKSLVSASVTGDVFSGVVPDGIAFAAPPRVAAANADVPGLEIGDPWSFYHKFWQAHGLDHLASLVPNEISVHVNRVLAIPLVVHNPSNAPLNVHFAVQAPNDWKVDPVAPVSVAPHSSFFLRVLATAPPVKQAGWQPFVISAEADHQKIGDVALRAELSTGWVAPQ